MKFLLSALILLPLALTLPKKGKNPENRPEIGDFKGMGFADEDISAMRKKLRDMQKLDLKRNRLLTLHNLKPCSRLRELDITSNPITSLRGLENLTSLEVLIASKCRVAGRLDFRELAPCLKSLIATDNNIQKISNLASTPALKNLILSRNCIRSGGFLKRGGQALEKVSLSHNKLSRIPRFGTSNKIRELRLNSNRFRTLPESLNCLKHLEILDLGQNRISEISENLLRVLRSLSSLRSLNLKGNPLTNQSGYPSRIISALSPRLEVLDGGRIFGEISRDFQEIGRNLSGAESGKMSRRKRKRDKRKKKINLNRPNPNPVRGEALPHSSEDGDSESSDRVFRTMLKEELGKSVTSASEENVFDIIEKGLEPSQNAKDRFQRHIDELEREERRVRLQELQGITNATKEEIELKKSLLRDARKRGLPLDEQEEEERDFLRRRARQPTGVESFTIYPQPKTDINTTTNITRNIVDSQEVNIVGEGGATQFSVQTDVDAMGHDLAPFHETSKHSSDQDVCQDGSNETKTNLGESESAKSDMEIESDAEESLDALDAKRLSRREIDRLRRGG